MNKRVIIIILRRTLINLNIYFTKILNVYFCSLISTILNFHILRDFKDSSFETNVQDNYHNKGVKVCRQRALLREHVTHSLLKRLVKISVDNIQLLMKRIHI